MAENVHCWFSGRFVLIAVALSSFRCATGQTRNNEVIIVKETEPVGHVIANLTGSGNCNVTSYTPIRSDRYFNMIENFLTLKEELDLDAGLQSQLETTNITVKITCYKSSHTLHVFIEPVNEFPPFFLDRPYYTTIPEV
ncbi:uncharacterized protein LOC127858860 [Dreissena polymorpha]|uniref:uncharacterized protein LOC127858860 n=1 Tax=Dreissena polymorpha TaxID=45954 RepID=UPI00226523FB|nr:uncharacterized protein LOC127858860 [Dreissena polymorpha]